MSTQGKLKRIEIGYPLVPDMVNNKSFIMFLTETFAQKKLSTIKGNSYRYNYSTNFNCKLKDERAILLAVNSLGYNLDSIDLLCTIDALLLYMFCMNDNRLESFVKTQE